jgi:hypothetical protein
VIKYFLFLALVFVTLFVSLIVIPNNSMHDRAFKACKSKIQIFTQNASAREILSLTQNTLDKLCNCAASKRVWAAELKNKLRATYGDLNNDDYIFGTGNTEYETGIACKAEMLAD